MEKYTVTFGNNLKVIVWAKNHNQAVLKALNNGDDKTIAMLTACLKSGDHVDDELLYSIEYLKNNGFLKGLSFKKLD